MDDQEHNTPDGGADWISKVAAMLEENQYREVVREKILQTLRASAEILVAAGRDSPSQVAPSENDEQLADRLCVLANVAEEELHKANHADGREDLEQLTAAAYALRVCAHCLGIQNEKPVGLDEQEYRAKILMTGWAAGEALALLQLTKDGYLRKALRWDWHADRRSEGLAKGNRTRAAQHDRWSQKLRSFAISALSADPDTSDSDLVQAFARSGQRFPGAAAEKSLREWRRDGTLPPSPSQRRKMEAKSGER